MNRLAVSLLSASIFLTACGGSSQDISDSSESSKTSKPESTSANSLEQSVSVDDELALVDFKTRCIVDRISDSGNLWFTVELTNEFDEDREFTVYVNAFYEGEFKAEHSFDTREIESDKRGSGESFIKGVDEGTKRLWSCEVYELQAR